MSSLQYDESTIQKIFNILDENKDNVDEKTWLEICNFMKDVNSFHKIPILKINGRYVRRTLKPTNEEMIMRFNNQIVLIKQKIELLKEEEIINKEIHSDILLHMKKCKKKNKQKLKIKLIDISEELNDINYYIRNYNIILNRYNSRIQYLMTLEPNDIYNENYVKVETFEDACSNFSSDSE